MNIARIKAFAKSKGVTQTYLCTRLGLRKNYLSDVQNGKDKLTEDRLNQIAQILGTTPEYLSGETDDPAPAESTLSPAEIELLNLYRKMNHHGQQQALDVVRGLSLLPENQKERDRSRAVTAVG